MPIITQRLGFSEEDMNEFKGKVTNSGSVVRSDVYRVVKKYFKNYH